jgi:hypothetical protein
MVTTPNRWAGGRVVAGGLGKTPAVLIPAGIRDLYGSFANQPGTLAELFVAMRGTDDQIWALNMSRFATFDVLEDVYRMTVDTTTAFPVGPNNGSVAVGMGVSENKVLNIFENLETFLRTPSKYWDSLSDVKNGGKQNCPSPGGNGITIYPNLFNGSEWVDGQCKRKPPIASGVVVDGVYGTAWRLWEEFGHEVLGMNRASTTNDKDWRAAFEDLKPKSCSSLAQCSPDNSCIEASKVGDWTAKKAGGGNKKVCASGAVPPRPSGFATDYALSSDEHNWIYIVLLYRWFGDSLRGMARGDAESGDTRLQTKYDYIRDHMFNGVEFNGGLGSPSAGGDETTGLFAMPMR